MANQITDNRTLLDAFDNVTNKVDLTGSAAGTQDTEVKIEGSASVGQYLTSALDGLLLNLTSATDVSGNVFYIRVACSIVSLLDTKANGGFRVRFCGATISDWFEVYVGGSDEWPPTVKGQFVTFVIDIDEARSVAVTNGWTNGTTPATTAIQYVGIAGITAGTMPRMVDNVWLDAMYRLPANTAGIIVEGRNGGTSDWTPDDIYTQLGDAAGLFIPARAGGAWIANTPIQYAINDGSTHGSEALNSIILWQDQEFVVDGFYKISIVGAGVGTVNVDYGLKSGTGDAATGAQGAVIAAGSNFARWVLDANGADIDAANFYGCTFIHGGQFDFDASHVECVSTTFVDCDKCIITNGLAQRCKVVDANTVDGDGFFETDDLGDIRFCEIEFSDGHGVELVGTATISQDNVGNQFSASFGGTTGSNLVANSGSTDAAVFNDQGDDITLNSLQGASNFSVRNGVGATTTVVDSASLTLAGIPNGSVVVIYDDNDADPQDMGDELARTNSSSGNFVYTYDKTKAADTIFVKVVNRPNYKLYERQITLAAVDVTLDLPIEAETN